VRTAAAAMPARTDGRLGSWLSVRHSLRAEAVLVLVLYGVFDSRQACWAASTAAQPSGREPDLLSGPLRGRA
jgi:hypothetical protein